MLLVVRHVGVSWVPPACLAAFDVELASSAAHEEVEVSAGSASGIIVSIGVMRWMAMLDKVMLVLQMTLRVLEASRRTWDAAFAKTRAHSRRPASLGAAVVAT
jgi:hypothetical protein